MIGAETGMGGDGIIGILVTDGMTDSDKVVGIAGIVFDTAGIGFDTVGMVVDTVGK